MEESLNFRPVKKQEGHPILSPNFTDEGTEDQRSETTCLKPHSNHVWDFMTQDTFPGFL